MDMKPSASQSADYKAKYYELRRTAKELIFENSAYQAEIQECHKMIAQRERERELLLQHLLQYEQEAWELQSEMNNAHTEKHKLMKKQHDSEKRKRVRVDTHLAEAAAIAHTHEPDGSASKIPKIKIVFQQKGPGVAPSAEPVGKLQSHSSDSNSEAKTAIKNKIKRNKLDPIVISLPSTAMFHNKDPLSHQQTVKRPRPANLGLNLAQTNLMAASRASGLMLSPSLLAQSPLLASQLSNSSHTFSPSIDINQLLAQRSADHTPVDIFSESETSCAASPADGLGEDTRTIKAHAALAIDETTARAIKPHPALAIDDTAARTIKTHPSLTMDESEHYTMPFKRCPDVGQGFRISPSALRSIKQKIDSINANQSSWKAASKNIKSPSLTVPNSSEHGKKSDAS